MKIYTCDSCGSRVTELQLQRGEAVESEGYVYCSSCADELGLEPEEEYSYDDAREGREAYAPPTGINVKLLAGVTVGAIVLGGAIGLFLLTGKDEKPPRREALSVRPPDRPRREEPVPEEEPELARRAEVEVARRVEAEPAAPEAVPPPARGAGEPAEEESRLVAGFEEEGYRFECASAALAERVRGWAARGEGALRALKRRHTRSAVDARVRVSFPAPVDLTEYNKLGFWLRSSGIENDFKLALITSGRQAFIPAAQDTVFTGEWTWFEFFLAGGRDSVEGLVLRFNERSEPAAYYVYLDEVRAYEKPRPFASAPAATAPTAAPAAASGTRVLSAARPGGRELHRYDFDGTKPLVWRQGELASPGKSGAGKCLKSVVHMSGRERYENVRLQFEPSLKVEKGMVAFFSYKLDKSAGLSVACDSRARGGKVRVRFRDLKSGEWGTVRFLLTDLVTEDGDKCEPGDELGTLAIFARGRGPERKVYVDDFLIAAEEAAPAPPAVAQEAKPAARLDVTGGGQVLLANDFEDGAGAFKGGKVTSTSTYRSSRASFKATVDLKDKFYSCRIHIDKWTAGKRKEKGIAELSDDTVIAFAYYLDGAQSLTLMSWFEEKKENFRKELRNLPQKTWTLAQVRYLDFASNDSKSKEKLKKGDWPQNLSWLSGKAGADCTLMVDDVVICNGRIPGDIGRTLKTRLDKKRETVADPRKDGFYMTMEMVDALAERFKQGGAKRKTLAVLGGRLAASNYFLAPLAKPGKRLDPENGYKFIPKMALAQATRRLSSYRRRDALKKALERYGPEVVVILAGYNDLKRGLPTDEVQTEYSYICECCLEAGALPVLITVPMGADVRTQAGGLALGYSGAAFKTAKTIGVPMIDAHSWLNAEGKSKRTYFSTSGLKQPAYGQLNSLFVEVYDRLEKYVLPREE